MVTTPRSEAQDACPYCHGKLSIIVSRDPDEEVDCVCTDPPEETDADRVDAFAKSLGIELMPWQRTLAVQALSGEPITFARGRRSGRSTVERIVKGVKYV
ncbi:hypothetical protein NS234_12130 [Microbacterium oxydans]|uniref:hypothetical protein n=1 Tax=Microbacterium oxydans TaxID=82380 RepID=UPI000734EA99|nr:hypothetical protein [Microbacterium oxydans]KTR76172.1 hypothetical protein NS234_12130 [Microbacterium oxydans]